MPSLASRPRPRPRHVQRRRPVQRSRWVSAPRSYADVAELTASHYRLPDLDTPISTLTLSRDRSWQDILSEPGAHSITFQNDDTDAAAIRAGDLIAYDLRGRRAFVGICEQYDRTSVAPGEEADQVTTWTGRGHLALLSKARVFPARGLGGAPVEEDRVFDWRASVYDDSSWSAGFAVCTVADAKASWGSGPANYWDQEDWFQDDTADVLGPTDGTDTDVSSPNGANQEHYFRQEFTIATAGTFVLIALCDNLAEFYIDGGLVLSHDDWVRETHTVVRLDAGTHLMAVHLHNVPQVAANPTGVAWVLRTPGYTGVLTVAKSDASDVVQVQYQAEPPGMTPGEVMRIVVEEAQARGILSWLTLDFTDTHDSDGTAWPIVADIATKVGTDYLTFFREIAGTYADIHMDPNGSTLHAWNYGERGETKAMVLEQASGDDPSSGNLTMLRQRGEAPLGNAQLIRWGGGWGGRSRASSDPTETLLGLGAIDNATEMQRVAAAQLAIYADTREEIEAGYDARDLTEYPYHGFEVGDTITVPDSEGSPTAERVTSVTVTEDSDIGRSLFQLSLKDVVLAEQERFAQQLKKMTEGTGGGRIKVAQPVVPTFIPSAPAVASEEVEWGELHHARAGLGGSNSTTNLDSDGSDPTQRSLDLLVDGGSLVAWTDSYPPSRDQWNRIHGLARALNEVDTDVTVSATISGVGSLGIADSADTFQNFDWVLLARSDEHDDELLSDGLVHGWRAHFYTNTDTMPGGESGVYFEVCWDDGGLQYASTSATQPLSTGVLQVGDVLSLTVSGTGASTVVTAKVNGTTELELAGGDLTTFLSANSIDAADLPLGTHAGWGLEGSTSDETGPGVMPWTSAMDNDVALEGFSTS